MDRELLRHWTLAPELTFLNHGSFGACPREVLAFQSELRARLEASPVQFMLGLPALLEREREVVAPFVGAKPRDLVFVRNATEGVNAVVRSFPFQPGDEILASDHGYPACLNAIRFAAEQRGASVRIAEVPFPLNGPADIVEAFRAAITPRTRLALIDHVTSATALIFPVAELAQLFHAHGVECLVDGAHAPGMVDLDVAALGVDYYAMNFHKWVCAPKGAGALWVRAEKTSRVYPTVVSHGLSADPERRFQALFDWTGTSDPSAWLCVGKAIEFMGKLLSGGWSALRAKNHELVVRARDVLCATLGMAPPAPEALLGSMATLPLAPLLGSQPAELDPLYSELVRQHFEVPVLPWPALPRRIIRVSAQLYNTLDDYERLAKALSQSPLATERTP